MRIFFTFVTSRDDMNMRKSILIIFALILLTACRGRQTQTEKDMARMGGVGVLQTWSKVRVKNPA